MTKADQARSLLTFSLLTVCLCGAGFREASAQATLTGKVVNEQGAPLMGASVSIPSLGVGTTTNDRGTYLLNVSERQAQSQQVVVTARFIGYSPQQQPVTLTSGSHVMDFTLKSDPFRLEGMIVTGVAESTSVKKLSFSVAQVTSDQVKDVPAANPIAALAGKVAGAKIELGVGNPGANPAIRLRGSTNLTVGASAPLIIVDGVILKDVNRNSISDIDAQDIESIEVLKGAAASSFYGSDAANGVINITMKRGRNLPDNHVSVTARTEYGQSGIPHWISLNHSHDYVLNSDGTIELVKGSRVVETDQIADNPYPSSGPGAWRNQLKTWLGNNNYYNNDVQVGLRRGNTNFNSSFSTDHNGGILPFRDGQYKQNARMNVDQGLGDKVDLSGSFTYGLQRNDYNPTSSAGWFELLQAPPDVDLAHPNGDNDVLYDPAIPAYASPNARANPLYQLANEQYRLRRERILGSAALRYRPFQWLRLEGNYGTDRLNEQSQTYDFRGYLNEAGNPGDGSLTKAARSNVSWNSQLRATASKLFFSKVLSTTSAAYQLENSHFDQFSAGGTQLNVTNVLDLAALDPTQLTLNSDIQDQRTIDYMASQSFDIKDRYILDGLYRRDGSSLFGPNNRWADFYRISGAYRISEDFHIPGFQELKIRAARGTAGLRPRFLDQYEYYNVSGGQITKSQLGNKNLKPAILTENEYGINSSFLDRFDLELVFADRNTKGAFLDVPLSLAQSGGFTSQIQNAADVGSKSFEVSLQARVIDRPNYGYNISITGDHTTQRILSMNRAPFRVAADNSQGQNVFYYAAGQPLGIIYGTRFVHTFAQLKENPAFANAVESDYVVNPLGYLVPVSTRGTSKEQPIVYVDGSGQTNFVIGNVNPDFNFGFANDFHVGPFNIHALFDGQKGGQIYNFSKQWMFQDLRSGDIDQSGKDASQKVAQPFYSAGLYNGLNADEYFVEDGSYIKLRELSVAYNLAPRFVQKIAFGRATGARIALVGRNLYTWTHYSGFDPDVTAGSDFNYRIDGFRYPNFRTITGQFEIQF
jgi:TonB-linked SusC/RagA family outer membrane protein